MTRSLEVTVSRMVERRLLASSIESRCPAQAMTLGASVAGSTAAPGFSRSIRPGDRALGLPWRGEENGTRGWPSTVSAIFERRWCRVLAPRYSTNSG